jgi:soluble lytic murein transglycosylase
MRMIDEYPEAELSYRGMLLSAVTRYRLQQYDQALAGFQRALSLAVNPEDQAASYLWLGKLAERDGDVEEARALWTQAVQADPTGYYSERAREILNGETPLEGPEIYNLDYDLEQERRLAELWLRNTFELADNVDLSDLGSLTNDERIIRGNEFTELGLYSLAGLEFEDLRSEVASDPAANFRLLNHLVDIGFYRPAIFISRQILGLAGMDDFATFSAPSYFNHIRFGIYFSDLILPAAESEGLHPLFLYSVIRQESLFEAHAYSSAGAQGLMQVIPSTGQEIAGQLNWPDDYSDADLYRPIVSIRFGSHYLARQVDFFDGDLYASLAAYNGGPGNAYQWKELAGDDPDLFLETIRIQETRDYLLFISEFMHIYERLYGRDPGEVVQ